MDWMNVILPPTTALVYGGSGWLKNAWADGKISWPEWKQLFTTVLVAAIVGYAAAFGLNMPAEAASGIGVVAYMLFRGWRKSRE